MYKKRMACIAYQAYYNQAPDSINNLFIKHHPQRVLRDNLKFQIQRPNSNFRRDSFSHRACNLWNNLPVTIKNKPSLSLFKKALKNQELLIQFRLMELLVPIKTLMYLYTRNVHIIVV